MTNCIWKPVYESGKPVGLACFFCDQPPLRNIFNVNIKRNCTSANNLGTNTQQEYPELTSLVRIPPQKSYTLPPPAPNTGPGTELEKLIDAINLSRLKCMVCTQVRNQMNIWGIQGCRNNITILETHITNMSREVGWVDTIKASIKCAEIGIFSIKGLINRAIDNAEIAAATESSNQSPPQ